MKSRDTFLLYAPYLYLSRQEGRAGYRLFVAIRKRAGEEVSPVLAAEGQPAVYEAGLTAIRFSVSALPDASEEEACDFFLMDFDLEPEVRHPSGFDPGSWEVKVEVEVKGPGGKTEPLAYSNMMPYMDADTRPAPEKQPGFAPAYNCPYVYLAQQTPGTDTDASSLFHPHVLLAPKGYRLSDQQDRLIATSPGNGVFESILVLSRGNDTLEDDSFAPFINPARLKVNTETYSDSGQAEGNFAVTVVFMENEAEAEAFRSQELPALSRGLLDMEQASAGNTSSGNGAPEPVNTVRKAKTRNMSSRRNRPRSIDSRFMV